MFKFRSAISIRGFRIPQWKFKDFPLLVAGPTNLCIFLLRIFISEKLSKLSWIRIVCLLISFSKKSYFHYCVTSPLSERTIYVACENIYSGQHIITSFGHRARQFNTHLYKYKSTISSLRDNYGSLYNTTTFLISLIYSSAHIWIWQYWQ